ncbi:MULTISPECIES: sulfotransferase family protein [unclassified Streptomyces]|uniref:sulfotransferase family protein n=1 Tax=Streptomyces TaxID=1883 RepID=UPI00137D00A9|nr:MULTISPECIES: sulfotransferase family protein [unclassified Streptomyces]MYY87098.1 sulfotransferase family protein [Streptomyces sp. SID335]MYZ18985.1 sulfotransferase family protein [Streptomyces sp. SID337]
MMKIIGAGFGRTGTLSVKAALETLGLGPCYHMMTMIEKPEHLRLWNAICRGERADWARIFAGYQSTVDWPACDHWERLAQEYPDAKVLLTVRDPARWYDSFRETLAPVWAAETDDPEFREYLTLVRHIAAHTFGGRLNDRAHAIAVFEEHSRKVRAAIPAERLLVHDVREGWAPLCEFFGRPVPTETEFPHLNDRATFHELLQERLAHREEPA